MSCPTCSHTMQSVGGGGETGRSVYWCPRCGTLRTVVYRDDADREEVEAPRLVERCRTFEAAFTEDGLTQNEIGELTPLAWRREGIAESIHPAGHRGVAKPPAEPADEAKRFDELVKGKAGPYVVACVDRPVLVHWIRKDGHTVREEVIHPPDRRPT